MEKASFVLKDADYQKLVIEASKKLGLTFTAFCRMASLEKAHQVMNDSKDLEVFV